jgi:hypothetical protein
VTDIRDMTIADRMRLKAHRASHKLFQKLIKDDTIDGQVARLSPTEWVNLRTLIELGYVDIEDSRIVFNLSISSLQTLGYI